MPSIPGTVVIDKIVPSDTADTYPTHDDKYGAGGLHTDVLDIVERNNIPVARRKQGMIVHVKTPIPTNYQLVGGITNSDWVVLNTGSELSKAFYTVNEDGFQVSLNSINFLNDTNGFTLKLPNPQNPGDTCIFIDLSGNRTIEAVAILSNGNIVNGAVDDYNLDINYGVLTYISDGTNWVVY